MSEPTRTVNVQEAKTHLSRLLRQVEAGEEIAIARAGRVIAHLVRAPGSDGRRFGAYEGTVTYDADAFDPMTDAQASDWYDSDLEP